MDDSKAIQYVTLLQKHFPEAKVFWKKPPTCALDILPCSLAISFSDNPDDPFVMDFPKGIGEHSVEQDVSTFIGQIKILRSRGVI